MVEDKKLLMLQTGLFVLSHAVLLEELRFVDSNGVFRAQENAGIVDHTYIVGVEVFPVEQPFSVF